MVSKRFAFTLLSVLFLVACSTDQSYETRDNQTYNTDEAMVTEETFTGSQVIQQVDLSFETAFYDDVVTHVEETARSFKGTMEYANENRNQRRSGYGPELQSYRRKEYTFRIPTESLDDFLDEVDNMEATKLWERIGSQDVSEHYTDLEARLALAKQKEERLTGLLDEATTIEEIMLIEEQLTIAIQDREFIQSEIDSVDSVVDRTVVQLTIEELGRISNQPQGRPGFWDRASRAVVDSFYSFYFWLQDALIWLIFVLPYLVIGLILLLLIKGIQSLYRKSDYAKKRSEKHEELRMSRKSRGRVRRTQTEPAESKPDQGSETIPPESKDES